MYNLLSGNISRLWKDKTFWLCMAAMLAYAVIYMLNGCRQARLGMEGYHTSIDDYYFHFAVSIGLFIALFSSMFLGTEYSDGTIRNKVVVGHTRADIYVANLAVTFLASLLIMAAWLAGGLVAVPELGLWELSVPQLLVYLAIAVLFVAALSSIFTFVAMLSVNKAVTVAVSICLFLGMLFVASTLYNGLAQPEMASGLEVTVDGVKMGEPTPNPAYISGGMRKLYEFLLDFLPTGQGIMMWQLEIGNPIRMILSSVLLTVGPALGGMALFSRKNLK
ncbi:MAG: ABC transporter permease subunit [Lachnospiraceae bacterium]|nr:ABC transporter permease subunit [Lachnospiraceae bacterium]